MRKLRLVALLVLILLACRVFQPGILAVELPPGVATPNRQLLPGGDATPTPLVTPAPVIEATPTIITTMLASATETGVADFKVHTHPEGALYVGDRVSFEIIPGADFEIRGQRANVRVVEPVEVAVGEVEFERFGIGQRKQATLTWAWDTGGLQPGRYTLEFVIQPQGATWRQAVELLPAEQQPQAEAGWKEAQLDCCEVHYISGTEVERDLDRLLELLNKQSQQVSEQLGTSLEQPISVTLAPRVLGHGGFAGSGITISYLDRLYTSSDLEMIFHHELVHIYDSQLGGELRPTMLVEGLAVYLSGGHFKPEPLLERAAALLPAESECIVCGLGWYIPLPELVEDFYISQHEVGYLEAGALVEFLVERYGWEGFNAFYRDIHPHSTDSQALAMEAALQTHFGLSLAELDEQFQAELALRNASGQAPVVLDPEMLIDVRLSVGFYNAVRHYQQRFDPSAYFQTAWLPDVEQMQAAGITADFLRRPARPENIILENLLAAVGEALQAGQYTQAEERLETVRYLLENIPDLEREAQAN